MIDGVRKLTVKYNGRLAGYLAELDGGETAFQYDGEWLQNGFSLSPFSLPLSNNVYINKKQTFNGVYGVFNDSLPDGWGELLVKRMLAKKGINYDRLSALTKLSLISENGLGGLTYEPAQSENPATPDYTLDEVAEEAKKILDDKDGEDIDFDKVFQLGGSSGGARPKAHIKDGGEYWIVKFPCRIDSKDTGKEEYAANVRPKNAESTSTYSNCSNPPYAKDISELKDSTGTATRKFIWFHCRLCWKQRTGFRI